MERRLNVLKHSKHPLLLLTGLGVSYLGNWIYLIALNLSILNLTGSAAAVAGLYVIRPIALMLTNTWSGSVIDRVNKRRLLIGVDMTRGILVLLLPFINSLWTIYTVLLLIGIAGAFFGPTANIFIASLIPSEKRQRFNSLLGMASSGAFLTGPAIAGILIWYGGTDLSIFVNGISFIVCAFLIFLLPDIDQRRAQLHRRLGFHSLVDDWRAVAGYISREKNFFRIYLLFQAAMLIGFALDSQEVTFIKQTLALSDQEYGLLVSLTGAGALAGASVSALFANRASLNLYLGGGMLLTSTGYLFFYMSANFFFASAAFLFLGFFMAFANAGYATFFQNHVPVALMGRFGSLADMFQGMVQIGLTITLGVFADWFTLQAVCIVFSVIGLFLSIGLGIYIFLFREGKAV